MDRLLLPGCYFNRLGVHWAVLKILLREWPPRFSRGVSGVAAALLLAAVAVASGETLRTLRRYKPKSAMPSVE